MAPRALYFSDDIRHGILTGVERLEQIVAPTLGPYGRPVLVDRNGQAPLVAESGYELALHLDAACRLQQIGVQTLRNMAWEITDTWGDGTATAILLASSIFRDITVSQARGIGHRELATRLADETEALLEDLRHSAEPAGGLDNLTRLARSSLSSDEALAGLLAEAADIAGPGGLVEIEEARGGNADSLAFANGYSFDAGWLSPGFLTDPGSRTVTYDAVHLLVSMREIEDFSDVVPMLEVFSRTRKPLVIIAPGFGDVATRALEANAKAGTARIAAIRAPGAGDWRTLAIADIAAATGATPVGDESGHDLRSLKPSDLGFAEQIRISAQKTVLTGGRADEVALQMQRGAIGHAIERSRHLSLDRDRHTERLGRLSGRVARVSLGTSTTEASQSRIEKARKVTRLLAAGRHGGIVEGGGRALADAGERIARKSEIPLLRRATQAPAKAIARNGGASGVPCNRFAVADSCRHLSDIVKKATAAALSLASADVCVVETRRAQAARAN